MRTFTARLAVVLALAATGVAAQTASDYIRTAVNQTITQTTVVRHPIDRNRYYLCWTDGQNRHGLRLNRAQFDRNLRYMAPGARSPLATVLGSDSTVWTAEDQRTCWPAG